MVFPVNPAINCKVLNHAAYRCKDTEETRKFYEDFIGLPLVGAIMINETKTGRQVAVLHSFFQIRDGSALAFFECPLQDFDFCEKSDFDQHIAFECEYEELTRMQEKCKAAGIECRGISDHSEAGLHSIYIRDPNGYAFEMTAVVPFKNGQGQTPEEAHAVLAEWQKKKPAAVYGQTSTAAAAE